MADRMEVWCPKKRVWRESSRYQILSPDSLALVSVKPHKKFGKLKYKTSLDFIHFEYLLNSALCYVE
jgi:hypothetical protein